MRSLMGALAAATLLGACYTYRSAGPVDAVMPIAGKRVRLELTTEGRMSLAQQIGPQTAYVEGDVIGADTTGLKLAMRSAEDSRHVSTDWKGEEVSFPRSAIASISERRVSVGSTALLGGLAAGGLLGAYAAFGGGGGAAGTAGGGGGNGHQ